MYDPVGTDNDREWLEIYNNGSAINLSGWKFYESGDHNLYLKNGSWVINDYAVIAEDSSAFLLDYPLFNGTLFDSSFSLKNSEGGLIALKDTNGNLIGDVIYNVSIGANGDGNSLQWNNSCWCAAEPTPGSKNNCVQENKTNNKGLKITVYLDNTIYKDITYTTLFKIENLDYISGQDYINANVTYNISYSDGNLVKADTFAVSLKQSKTADTGLFTPSSVGNYTICGWLIESTVNDPNKFDDIACKTIEVLDTASILCNISINISTEKFLYTDEETIDFYNNLNDESYPYIIEYWIEDLFGNIIKKKMNTTNTNKKSYSPAIDENDLVLLIKNELYPFCNDKNSSDNSAEKLIIVKTTNPVIATSKQGSTIDIEEFVDISNDKAKFGQTIRVKANIYKGNTRKNLVKAWIENDEGEKVSKESKINLYTKYIDYALAIPLQINPNCNYEFDDGTYKLFLEGLDVKVTKTLEIEGITNSLCDEKLVYEYKEETPRYKEVEYELTNLPEEIRNNEEFKLEIKLTNNENKEHTFDVWSYVYRGKKSYSGEREDNKIQVVLPKQESKIITLKNKIENAEPGDYKLKIEIKKDAQKTNKEITKDIKVIAQKEEINKERLFTEKKRLDTLTSEKEVDTGLSKIETIYESSNIKLKKLIPVLIISLLVVFNIVLVWKR